MSLAALFAIGCVVFFIGVYGVVMVGSLTLERARLIDDEELAKPVDTDKLKKGGLPTNVEY